MPDPTPTPGDLSVDLYALLAAAADQALRADVPPRRYWQTVAETWAGNCAVACRRAIAAEARAARLADLGDRLLACAASELVPGADLAREWAEARKGVGGA
jgi:hypothetical protein